MLQCGGIRSLNAQLGFFKHCQNKKRRIKTLSITKQKPQKLLVKIEKKTTSGFAYAPSGKLYKTIHILHFCFAKRAYTTYGIEQYYSSY